MHLPKKRNIERSGIYFRLNGHHLLHHRYMHKNFNVVFPLADLCLGTLLLRSKVHFKQADGPVRPERPAAHAQGAPAQVRRGQIGASAFSAREKRFAFAPFLVTLRA